MKRSILGLILMTFVTSGCDKIEFSVDNPFAGIPTRVLMHRGCGDNPDLVGNTLAAAEYGLSKLDGIELDIQLSKDGTLWLDHDNQVHDCDGNVVGCFQEMTDVAINAAAECNGVVRYHTLESVFQVMVDKYPNAFISLDIKGQYCQIFVIPSVMKTMARAVLDLVSKYNLVNRVLVESDSPAFLAELEHQSLVGQCVISLGDIDKGIANAKVTKSRAISLKYGVEEINVEVVKLIHNKGYGLVIWVVNEPDAIAAVWRSKPDFIQTDNGRFREYIPR